MAIAEYQLLERHIHSVSSTIHTVYAKGETGRRGGKIRNGGAQEGGGCGRGVMNMLAFPPMLGSLVDSEVCCNLSTSFCIQHLMAY